MNATQLKKLFQSMTDGGFTHLELKLPKVRVKMVAPCQERPPSETVNAAVDGENPLPPAAEKAPDIKVISERVGVFAPGKTAPVVGGTVKKGEVMGIIKGISIQDQIIAPVAGKISSVHAKTGDLIEFGKLLFTISPQV